MNTIWAYLKDRPWPAETKYRFARMLPGILSALAGLAVWLLIRPRICSGPEWSILLTGYPAVVSWLAAVLYSYRHDLP